MSNTVSASNPIDEWLADAKPTEVEVELCLDRDLRDRYTAAEIALTRLLTRSPVGITEAARAEAADKLAAEQFAQAEAVEAIAAEMAAASTVFLFRNISWTEAQIARAVHPPRRDDDGKVIEQDRMVGYNWSTLPPELITRCIVSVTFPGKEPTDVTYEQWIKMSAVLEPEQMDALAAAVLRMVWRPADPKSGVASALLATRSGAKSNKPANSGSPINGS